RNLQSKIGLVAARGRAKLGQSAGGRYLFIVIEQIVATRFRVITARDMDQSERKRYRERVK
ncbi:MAG: hypothetical protein QME81_03975, partial [bacterium]|nr:hypothetical protein [bacterium]